jgi:hypothetical protein
MKTILIATSLLLILNSCNERQYQKGAPIIVQKQKSMTGSCLYTYEGYGREEWFEDECDKYSVGDTLK